MMSGFCGLYWRLAACLLSSSACIAVAQTFTVQEITLNGGEAGQTMTFGANSPAEVVITENETTKSLDITVTGVNVRLKCGAQTDPDTCVLYADAGEIPPTPEPDPGPDPFSPVPVSDAYCDGADPGTVLCEPSVNLDSIYEATATRRTLTEPAGPRIRSIPFTTIDSTTASGSFGQVTTANQGTYAFRAWFSATPNGEPLQADGCDQEGEPQYDFGWTQKQGGAGCFLGSTGRILYLNYQAFALETCEEDTDGNVVCGPYAVDIKVDVKIQVN